MTTKEFSTLLQNKLTSEYGVDLSVASNQQIYRALALICRQMMSDNYKKRAPSRCTICAWSS